MKDIKQLIREEVKSQIEETLNGEGETKTLIQKLIKEEVNAQLIERLGRPKLDTSKRRWCPDCGNLLSWNSYYHTFAHHNNAEQLDCWYTENEYGDCVDNNQIRAERIKKYEEEGF